MRDRNAGVKRMIAGRGWRETVDRYDQKKGCTCLMQIQPCCKGGRDRRLGLRWVRLYAMLENVESTRTGLALGLDPQFPGMRESHDNTHEYVGHYEGGDGDTEAS